MDYRARGRGLKSRLKLRPFCEGGESKKLTSLPLSGKHVKLDANGIKPHEFALERPLTPLRLCGVWSGCSETR